MKAVKITITLDKLLLDRLDRLVKKGSVPSRSRAIQVAIQEKLARINKTGAKTRLARACAQLDPKFEREMAEGYGPAY